MPRGKALAVLLDGGGYGFYSVRGVNVDRDGSGLSKRRARGCDFNSRFGTAGKEKREGDDGGNESGGEYFSHKSIITQLRQQLGT